MKILRATDRLISNILNRMARFSARHSRPRWTGLVLQYSTKLEARKLNRQGRSRQVVNSRRDSETWSVWFPRKAGGGEDMLALQEVSSRAFALHPVRRQLVKSVTQSLYGSVGRELSEATMLKIAQEYPSEHERAIEHWSQTVDSLKRTMGIHALVSANWKYWAERSMHRGAQRVGVVSLAMHKECFATPLRYKEMVSDAETYGASDCEFVATYNNYAKAALVEGSIVAEDKCFVVGAPRFDALHSLRRERFWLRRKSDVRRVVFFSSSPRAGLALDASAGYETASGTVIHDWKPEIGEMLHVAENLARSRSDIEVVIKVKIGRDSEEPVRVWEDSRSQPLNLRVEYGGLATDSLLEADAAIGLNTTALLEVASQLWCKCGERGFLIVHLTRQV